MTILETVIAATIISVAIVASLKLSTNTQKEANYAKNLSLATKYNYQIFDWFKAVKSELGWTDLSGKVLVDGDNSLYCLSLIPAQATDFLTQAPTSKDSCSTTIIPGTSGFYRTAELSIIDGNTLSLKVKTYWQGKTEYSVQSETRLSNY